MIAKINIPSGYLPADIAVLAGKQPGPDGYWMTGRTLVVEGVTQTILDGALASYKHLPALRNQRMKQIRAKRDRFLSATDWAAQRAWEMGVNRATFTASLIGVYRKALRELPNTLKSDGTLEALKTQTAIDGFTPSWPTQP